MTIRKIAIGLLIFLLVAIAICLSTLSYTLPIAASHWLKDYNVVLDIEKMDLQLFSGKVAINNLSIRDINSPRALTLSQAQIDIDVRKILREKNLLLNSLRIINVNIPITENNGAITIAGIDPERFSQTKTEQPSAAEKPKVNNSEFAWGSIVLENILLDYSRSVDSVPAVLVPLTLQSFALGPFSSTAIESPTSVQARFNAVGVRASFAGEITPLDNGRPGHITAKISDIDLGEIATLITDLGIEIPPSAEALKGVLDYEGRIDWWLTDQRTFINLKSSELKGKELLLELPDDTQVTSVETAVKRQLKTVSGDLKINADEIKIALNPLHISLTQLNALDSTITYIDNNLSPVPEVELKNINLNVDSFDMGSPNKPSTLVFEAKMGNFGKLAANGKLALLNPKSNGNILFEGEQLNLSNFSGFSNAAIRRKISKGALDFNFNAAIVDGIMDSKIKIEAHQLSFGKTDKEDMVRPVQAGQQVTGKTQTNGNVKQGGFESELGMPFNTALNLLRDKDDTIRMKIPVKGPVDDPNININSVINKAIFKSFQTAVITQIGPLMALSALDKVKSLSDAAKLKPATFTALQTELTPDQLVILDKLATFLEKRERIKVNICGVATQNEIAVVGSEMVTAPNTVVTEVEPLTPAEKEQLQKLAIARGVYAKNYLIDKAIDGKRLILCGAEIETKQTAQPRVDFSL